jgi:hypothetical protein
MPHMEIPQLVFLGSVLVAFGAFTVTLISVSLYTMAKRSPGEPMVAREVIPAKRTETLKPDEPAARRLGRAT